MVKKGDLMNLCFSCLIDGTGVHEPISLEEAKYTLECWKQEGTELAEEVRGLSAEEFMKTWNQVFSYLCGRSENT